MKQDILKEYNILRASLKRERARLQNRLAKIQAALGSETSLPVIEAEAPVRRKRRVSAAGRAAIRKAAKARWAAYRAKRAGKPAPKRGRKARKFFSAAARAALSAAAKRRWAKARAAGRARL